MIKYEKLYYVRIYIVVGIVYLSTATYAFSVLYHPYISFPAAYVSVSILTLVFSLLLSHYQNKFTKALISKFRAVKDFDNKYRTINIPLDESRAWKLVNGVTESIREFRIEERSFDEGAIFISAWKSWKSWGEFVFIKLIKINSRQTIVKVSCLPIAQNFKKMKISSADLITEEIEKNNLLNVGVAKN